MGIIIMIYLAIGFLLDIMVENAIRTLPSNIIDNICGDINLNDVSIRFVLLLVCLFGWPIIIIKLFLNE